MSITIKDIAKHAGVSYSTVSKALRGSPLVKEPTKNKILKIAEELGYVPNVAARSLVQKKSYAIGVVWPSVERVVPAALITNINDLLEEQNYITLLSINKAESAISTFNRFQVDAIVVFGEDDIESDKKKYLSSQVPILFFGLNQNNSFPTIDVNRRLAIKLAVKHLLSQGIKNISFIGETESADPLQREKYIGFLEAMQEYHTSSESIIPTNGVETYDGYIAAKTLFDKQKNDVRGIVSASYDLTRGILKAANEFQINIPNDVTIISYDHIPPQKDELEVPFSQVGVPITDIAEKITETILEIIDGKEIDTPILLEPKINLPKLVINE